MKRLPSHTFFAMTISRFTGTFFALMSASFFSELIDQQGGCVVNKEGVWSTRRECGRQGGFPTRSDMEDGDDLVAVTCNKIVMEGKFKINKLLVPK
jgi:hypothetical protein